MRRLFSMALLGLAVSAVVQGQPAATQPVETILKERLGLPDAELPRFTAGQPVVWSLPATADNEVAAGGAIRTKGDLRRLVAWLRDIESFIRATGSVNVGAIQSPANAAEIARINFDDLDVGALAACRPGNRDVRMPAAYIERFQKGVNWKAGDARAQAIGLTRTLIREYVDAYQQGGDMALGAYHDQRAPELIGKQFQEMLRGSTRVWELAYPFASYLETFPKAAPVGVESRFYWTRDKVGRNPTLTLHHVVLQQYPDGRVMVADKQIYASREIDAALMIALAVPTKDNAGFDLVVAIKARADGMGGVAGRMLRGRIEKSVTEGLKSYLEWLRGSMAL